MVYNGRNKEMGKGSEVEEQNKNTNEGLRK